MTMYHKAREIVTGVSPSVGTPLDRVDGRLKVTGGARYSAEFPAAGMTYAVIVQSSVYAATRLVVRGEPIVRIRGRVEGGALSLTVADDGMGFRSEGSGTGIGLKNLRERLRLTYGPTAGFVIGNNFPNGVAATITLPAKGASDHA